jgi:hypothetical protein
VVYDQVCSQLGRLYRLGSLSRVVPTGTTTAANSANSAHPGANPPPPTNTHEVANTDTFSDGISDDAFSDAFSDANADGCLSH